MPKGRCPQIKGDTIEIRFTRGSSLHLQKVNEYSGKKETGALHSCPSHDRPLFFIKQTVVVYEKRQNKRENLRWATIKIHLGHSPEEYHSKSQKIMRMSHFYINNMLYFVVSSLLVIRLVWIFLCWQTR